MSLPAEGVDEQRLGGADVHRDVAQVAEERDPLAVAGVGHHLSPAEPLNWKVSLPRVAVDRLAAVARVPDHQVVAGAAVVRIDAGPARQRVVAGAAVQRVVAGVAVEQVDAVAAVQRVVAVAAVDARPTIRPFRPAPPVT